MGSIFRPKHIFLYLAAVRDAFSLYMLIFVDHAAPDGLEQPKNRGGSLRGWIHVTFLWCFHMCDEHMTHTCIRRGPRDQGGSTLT